MVINTVKQVSIFVAPNFDESFVTKCYCKIRDFGVPVDLVSTKTGSLKGALGLIIQPNKRIQQFKPLDNHLIIIPGGQQCASSLISDARIHQIIVNTFENGGYVATTNEAKKTFIDTGILTNQTESQFLVRKNKTWPEFLETLLHTHD